MGPSLRMTRLRYPPRPTAKLSLCGYDIRLLGLCANLIDVRSRVLTNLWDMGGMSDDAKIELKLFLSGP